MATSPNTANLYPIPALFWRKKGSEGMQGTCGRSPHTAQAMAGPFHRSWWAFLVFLQTCTADYMHEA